ncbi:hypothetical protein FIBSPDRAFT_909770 [Athelia psychrophila]|uniref:Uncharacterized protein n=1 Tax=Athelia psychrophila TaxID=1759441 RepID=A0A166NBG7_9AGAM|nr:hypothetical protein FIBSPDRAFT_909770 [Fibularhizoctonia sp. CBS 109695]
MPASHDAWPKDSPKPKRSRRAIPLSMPHWEGVSEQALCGKWPVREIARARPLFAACDLGNIQTIPTNNIPLLIHVLTTLLPKLIKEHSRPPARPVKLLVIDALAELFHLSDKTTTQTLVERSRKIYEISSLLHNLASQHHIAILVLNEVGDAFDRGNPSSATAELVYSNQSRFFNRGDSVPGESGKEASLGLVWANQVNVRIMLTRTGRRRHLEDVRVVGNKVQKIVAQDFSSPTEGQDDVATLIRRLNIIFSAVAPPRSLDYIVTVEETRRAQAQAAPVLYPATIALDDPPSQPVSSQVAPLDVGSAEDVLDAETEEPLPVDEWDSYWDQEEMAEGVYNNADVDNLLTGALA